jgi:hypothetical protein
MRKPDFSTIRIVDMGEGLMGHSVFDCKVPSHELSAVCQHRWLTCKYKGIISPAINCTAASGIYPLHITLFSIRNSQVFPGVVEVF